MNFMTLATLINLSPQARKIYAHMEKAGSISARDAILDYGITSATLARRICDLEGSGIPILRERRTHPIYRNAYTRYSIKGGDKVRVTNASPACVGRVPA